MGIFIEILHQINIMNENLDDGDHLTCFLHLMQKLNEGKPLNDELTAKIFEFFDYKWTHDRLMAIDDDYEIALLNQLPEFVQDKLVSHYLFSDFLMRFLDFFRIVN